MACVQLGYIRMNEVLWAVSSDPSEDAAVEASVTIQPWLSVPSGRFHSLGKHCSNQDTSKFFFFF